MEVAQVPTLPAAEKGVVLHASEEAWIQVRDRDRSILYEGTLTAGGTFKVPRQSVEPMLRVGNAGGLFVYVDGVAYGPVGNRGQVKKRVSLMADDVRTAMPETTAAIIRDADLPESQRSAEARLTRP